MIFKFFISLFIQAALTLIAIGVFIYFIWWHFT